MILQYKNPPSREELVELIKRAFVAMGYDTLEKRREWYNKQKPVWFWCTEKDMDE